jgi:hypothetical protein
VAAWVRAQVRSCEFVVDKVALGQVFSKYFDFPYQFSFHQLLYIHHLPSRAGTIGQLVADVPSGLSLPHPKKLKKKKINIFQFYDKLFVELVELRNSAEIYHVYCL